MIRLSTLPLKLLSPLIALLMLSSITGCAISPQTLKALARTPKEASAPSSSPTIVPTAPATPFVANETSSQIRNFKVGTRLSAQISDAQIDFVNTHYNYVVTPILKTTVREKIQGPKLILYRSIQGTWKNFHHFDWEYINAHENMFSHHQQQRIQTRWKSWLMDPGDMVDSAAPDAMQHWINYYAVTAAQQVQEYNYDGLFIDSAGHKLNPGAVYGKMPDDYNAETWRADRAASLKLIKSYLPNKAVIFNGLHNGAGAEQSLAYTDGGMWEVFAFQPSTGNYYGVQKWQEAIELTERNKAEKNIVLVAKKNGLTGDIQARMFVAASYLLVSNQNVALVLVDQDYDELNTILYYPEYDLNLGQALGNYTVNKQGLFTRHFQRGLTLVNPDESTTITFRLDGNYRRVIPVGGGPVASDGKWEGHLNEEPVSGALEIPPRTGVVLLSN